jgi:uncharacterized protein (TIGR00255 family)
MTAFARAKIEESGYAVVVEIKTLNGRNLDVVPRLNKNYSELEEIIRKNIPQLFRRGRVEVFVQIDPVAAELRAPQLNLQLARLYWNQLQDLHAALPSSDPPRLRDLLSIPHLFEASKEITDREVLENLLTNTLDDAARLVTEMRRKEGESLQRDCLERLAALRGELSAVEERKPQVFVEYQKRLRDRIKELIGEIDLDENRFLQEVAYLSERSDINEEIVRLKSHLQQFEELLMSAEPADGRRLDFLSQELHREVNTIGSKTGNLEIIQNIVRMKSEIGKLREQVQNVE